MSMEQYSRPGDDSYNKPLKRQRSAAVTNEIDQLLERSSSAHPTNQGPAGPADFSLFNASISKEKQQSQSTRPQQPNLRTFQDITSNRGRAEVVSNAQLNAIKAKSLALRSRTQSHSKSASQPANDTTRAPVRPPTLSTAQFPFDWTLKSAIRISSSTELTLFQTATHSPPTHLLSTLTHLLAPPAPAAKPSPTDLLHTALTSFRHPPTTLTPEALSSLSSAAPVCLQDRHSSWRTAFRSLYYLTRTGACPAFYLCAPPSSVRPLSVLFCAPSACSLPHLHALTSTSSALFRSKLAAANIPFHTPFAPTSQPPADAPTTTAPPAALPIAHDHTHKAALLFNGAAAVHGLFDLLFTDPPTHPTAQDLPILLAPIPFDGGTPSRLDVKLLGTSTARTSAPGGPPGAATTLLHRVDITGIIPPWCLYRICTALEAAQHLGFQLHLDTLPGSQAFNSSRAGPGGTGQLEGGERGEVLAEGEQRAAGAVGEEERERWGSALGELEGRFVRAAQWTPGVGFQLHLVAP